MKASLALAALLLTASISSANPNHARHNVYVDGWHNHCYEPSTYMEYNDGLALGKQQLAEQAAPKKPLADIARELRAQKAAQNNANSNPQPAQTPSK